MKAIFFPGESETVLKEVPDPRPGPSQILIKMEAAGLCGSDLHSLYSVPKEERKKFQFGIHLSPDVIPGHEPAGTVVELGPEVRYLRRGDRVVVYHVSGCGQCKFCKAGHPIHCARKKTYGWDIHGAFADYMVAYEKDCAMLPRSLSFSDGAYIACGASTAYKAIVHSGISGLKTVALFGMGPVGLAAAVVAKAFGTKTIGVDIMEERLGLARKTGVDHVLDARQVDPPKIIRDLTDGEGADAAIDCTGNATAINNALDCLAVFGKMVFVGHRERIVPIQPMEQVIAKQLTIIGSCVFTTAELQQYLDSLARFSIHFEHLITHKIPLRESPQVFRLCNEGKTGKVVIAW